VDRQQDVLAVPLAAVAMDGDGSYVMVIESDRLQRRAVQTGLVRGEWRQVLGGLKPGELIVTSSPADLVEGEMVRIVSRLSGERP
jgi:membrane fusion protein, multidrug efflux system